MSKQGSQPPNPTAASQAEGELDLSLEDTAAQATRALAGRQPQAIKGIPAAGYNPYDVSAHQLAAAARTPGIKSRPKPKDLRKLSDWIRTRHQVDALKKDDDPEST
ncbi:MAG: hypothetical protein ACREU2_07875 [Steroidobacteraceae bacterium]